MRLRACIWTAVTAALLCATLPHRTEAQARALGSPTGAPPSASSAEGTAEFEAPDEPSSPTGEMPAPSRSTPTTAPTSYEGVEVPDAPGAPATVRYPAASTGVITARPGATSRLLTPELGLRIPAGLSTRMRALDSDFQVLAARGGGSVLDGVLGILTGGLSITLGILLLDESSGTGGVNIAPYLFTLGGASVVRGVLGLALMTNPSGPAITYAHMPTTTLEEVRARIEYGERELSGLADRARLSRILDGSISVAMGLAIIPIYLGPNDFEIVNTFDWFVLIGAGISAISGVITLVSTTDAERRWSAYEQLRERLAARGDDHAALELEVLRDELTVEDAAERGGARLAPMATGSLGGGLVGVSGSF